MGSIASTTPPRYATDLTAAEDILTPIVHTGVVPARALSGGRLHLLGGCTTAPQRHDTTESVIAVLSGHVAVLTGIHMEPFYPRADDMVYIPATLPYAVVNLSM